MFGAKFDEAGHLVGLGHQDWLYHYYGRKPVSILVQIRPHPTGPAPSELGFVVMTPVRRPPYVTREWANALVAPDVEASRRDYDLDRDFHVIGLVSMDPDVNLATTLIFDRSDRGPLRVVPSGVELDVDAKDMLEHLHRRLRSACRDAGNPPSGSGGGHGH